MKIYMSANRHQLVKRERPITNQGKRSKVPSNAFVESLLKLMLPPKKNINYGSSEMQAPAQ